jgi:hypothetical protein
MAYILLSLSAVCLPLLFAWYALSRTARRHSHKRKGRPMR